MSLKILTLIVIVGFLQAQNFILNKRTTIQPYRNLSTEINVLSDNPYDDIRAYLG